MAWTKNYQDKDIQTLIEMWGDGYTATEIGDRLGKSMASVRQFVHRNRAKYNLEKKEGGRHVPRSSFDKEWHGVVPCKHWSITKPWSQKNGQAS